MKIPDIPTSWKEPLRDAGLLTLRCTVGGLMALRHGWPKFTHWADKHDTFPDPLGVSSPVSLALAIVGELVCGVLIAAGVFTRYAALPFIVTMAVAFFVVHAGDPLAKREMALLYLMGGVAVAMLGPGRWSVDGSLGRER